jgi:hypothetical protein
LAEMMKERTRILLVYCLLGLAPLSCDHRTGLVSSHPLDAGAPTQVLPSDAGICPATTSLCGTGAGARCYALDSDPMNCGTCGRACTPGIACFAGACQQVKCTGPVSFQQIASFPSSLATNARVQFEGYLGADMNRDGRLDLIEYNLDGDLMIWLGRGDGTFAASTSYETTGSASTWALLDYAAVGDFNEDGLADLVITRTDNSAVEVRPGMPGGGLGGHPGLLVSRFAMADLDGDGHLDVIDRHLNEEGGNRLSVLRGRGNGTFANAIDYTFPNDQIGGGDLRDWDGDGILDLLASGGALSILLGKGDGTFAEPQRCAPGIQSGQAAIFADLNRDGKLDIVWELSPTPSVATVLGLGGCGFTPRTDYRQSFQPGVFGIGDLSGDGVLDLALSSNEGGSTVLLLGKGDGSFVVQPELALDTSGSRLFIADVTNDGLPDIVSTGNRGIVVFANTCSH